MREGLKELLVLGMPSEMQEEARAAFRWTHGYVILFDHPHLGDLNQVRELILDGIQILKGRSKLAVWDEVLCLDLIASRAWLALWQEMNDLVLPSSFACRDTVLWM